MTFDRQFPDKPLQPIARSESGKYEISWCNWANDTRLLCGLRAMLEQSGHVYPVTRLIAVNADGSRAEQLIQNSAAGQSQFHDRILDWTPAEPDSVLIQLDDDFDGYPAVFEVDIDSGVRALRTRERPPIREFMTDASGNVRLGSGYSASGTDIEFYGRLESDKEWRRLAKFKAFEASDTLEPIAVAPGRNLAYATGGFEGRSALWEIDLTDQREPVLVFSHPLVDASTPLMTTDKRLLGIAYETDRPFVYYTDEHARSIMLRSTSSCQRSSTRSPPCRATARSRSFVRRATSMAAPGTCSTWPQQSWRC